MIKFLMRVRKPETGFFSSFQSENDDEGRSSQSWLSDSTDMFLVVDDGDDRDM